MKYIFYNPLSERGRGKAITEEYASNLEEEYVINSVENLNCKEFLASLNEEDEVILAGGDGTLNVFCNMIRDIPLKNKVYFLKAGAGNDFFHDMADNVVNSLILLNDYVKELPVVTVNGEGRVFINGIGFGIDGYCCEVGDELREKSTKPVNYAAIAIKGLLFKYKPLKAKVTVDGVETEYKKVWLAPTMKGKFYGGGMMIAPDQNRMKADRTVTNVVISGGKLPVLVMFPSIFKGKHVEYKELVHIARGKKITVKFDRPTALQIDGETVKNVSEYTVTV